MTSSLAKSKQIIGEHFQTFFLQYSYVLTFLNIHMLFIVLKTYDQQFTLTTKKSLHIIFNHCMGSIIQCTGASDLQVTQAQRTKQSQRTGQPNKTCGTKMCAKSMDCCNDVMTDGDCWNFTYWTPCDDVTDDEAGTYDTTGNVSRVLKSSRVASLIYCIRL